VEYVQSTPSATAGAAASTNGHLADSAAVTTIPTTSASSGGPATILGL